MLTQEEKDEVIVKFVNEYHIQKAVSGEGLESKHHWLMNPYYILVLPFRIKKEMEWIQALPQRLVEAEEEIRRQTHEIERSSLTQAERQALFELSFWGPIKGKEEVKRILPEILDRHEGLRMLSFMQELAHDLKVRR